MKFYSDSYCILLSIYLIVLLSLMQLLLKDQHTLFVSTTINKWYKIELPFTIELIRPTAFHVMV